MLDRAPGVALDAQRRAGADRRLAARAAEPCAARALRPDRRQGRLRRRRLRRLHGAHRRRTRLRLPDRVGQVEGRAVETIEGLSDGEPIVARLRAAFHVHGAAQCGVCTPAVLLAAVALLRGNARPERSRDRRTRSAACCAAAPAIARSSRR